MERHRTGGMTAVAILDVVFGGLGVLNGLYQVLGCFALMYELLRLGAFEIPVTRLTLSLLALATGIVGLIAGIGVFRLQPWARSWSVAYGGLLILLCVFAYFTVPIIASIGTYDLGSIGAYGWVRLIIFGLLFVVIPVPYALVLWTAFSQRAWKATFAKGRIA